MTATAHRLAWFSAWAVTWTAVVVGYDLCLSRHAMTSDGGVLRLVLEVGLPYALMGLLWLLVRPARPTGDALPQQIRHALRVLMTITLIVALHQATLAVNNRIMDRLGIERLVERAAWDD